jgi:hypothetical protein
MKSVLVLATLLACAGAAMAQNVSTGIPVAASGAPPTASQPGGSANMPPMVDTRGVSVAVSGSEVTATKKAGTDGVTTYVTEGPLGTTKTEVYEGTGGTRTNSTFIPR